VRAGIEYQDDVEPARRDWFVEGTQMTRIALASNARGQDSKGSARIEAPTDGTIFALDPDIPADRQRVWFESGAGAPAGSAWRLDGQRMQRAARMAWLPWPGHHTIELVDAKGVAVDTVKFEVRGAFARTAAENPHRSAGFKSKTAD
jgi:penicillin-binding protein 1C